MRNRVTKEYLDSRIAEIGYTILVDTTVTICMVRMKNGFVVTGKSACVDPRNFDAGIGRDLALKDAIDKVWELEGYVLAENRYVGGE